MVSFDRVLRCLSLIVLLLCDDLADAAGKRYALVVGVKSYRPGQPLPELPFTENDAVDLAKVLTAGGYQVTLMTQTLGREAGKEVMAPLSDYVRDQLDAMLDNPNLKDEDVVLVALAGHGVQYELTEGTKKTPKFYFCPADAEVAKLTRANEVTDRNRLLDLGELYAALNQSKAGGKLLLVDACRNDPTKPSNTRSLASVTLPPLPPPPGGMAAFFSCSAHQRAFEDKDLKHGIFFHHVIEALGGAADTSTAKRPADGQITLAELSEYVSSGTYDFVRTKYQGAKQAPELKGEFRLSIPLIDVKKDQAPPQEIVSKSTGMKLRLIPAGTFLMGNNAADLPSSVQVVRKLNEEFYKHEQPQHRVRISQPYYMGVHEVTQGEYESVMGTNPSYFSKTNGGSSKVSDQNTSKFPVEQVSWFDAIEFCNKLSAKDGFGAYYTLTNVRRQSGAIYYASVSEGNRAASAPGLSGYRLPTEAEWEYACRAGTTTVFHFDNALNGDQANIDDTPPYGTTGKFLARTTTVGSYAKNAFGLFDMHGNVWEWCQDVYDKEAYASRSGTTTDPLITSGSEFTSGSVYRVLRGGSWNGPGLLATSAYRKTTTPGDRSSYFVGVRVVR